ncbi:hypothetical protein [Nocardiopsis halotolerans]|uniref:hypothetical protein n=1 Tax=Nocardiopsis halotolerans TaxID=124252 RepID=UPI000346A7C5|nr:hypothetical protein [Nocardiopsis halotolerans]
MRITQPSMKRIKLVVPDTVDFVGIRDLDGTFTKVASPRKNYRFKRENASFEFASTGRTVDEDGDRAEVFTAVRVN